MWLKIGPVTPVTSGWSAGSYDGRVDWSWTRRSTIRRVGLGSGSLTVVVVSWWLILSAVTVWLLPEPTVSASAEGQIAYIHQVGLPRLPIPVSRAGFDAFQRGVREADEDAIDDAFAVSEWIHVIPGQAVRILQVDGDAIELQVLDGVHAGRRAWVRASNVRRSR
jgi:hypothetical protein